MARTWLLLGPAATLGAMWTNGLLVLRSGMNSGQVHAPGHGLIRTGPDARTGSYGLEGRVRQRSIRCQAQGCEEGSAQARPQVAGADGDHQDADQAADQGIGQMGLKAGTGVGTGQAAGPERDADRPVRSHRARLVE
jgi:hypothetical protein